MSREGSQRPHFDACRCRRLVTKVGRKACSHRCSQPGWGIAVKVVRRVTPAACTRNGGVARPADPPRYRAASGAGSLARAGYPQLSGDWPPAACSRPCAWSAKLSGARTKPCAGVNFLAASVPRAGSCAECRRERPARLGYTAGGCRAHLTGCGENNEMTQGRPADGYRELISSSWSVPAGATRVPSSCWC